MPCKKQKDLFFLKSSGAKNILPQIFCKLKLGMFIGKILNVSEMDVYFVLASSQWWFYQCWEHGELLSSTVQHSV